MRVQQQRAQRGTGQPSRGGSGGGLTMAERLASKHGVSGPSSVLYDNNSNNGGNGGAMTSQLKQLLGVQSPGRPTQHRSVNNSNNGPWQNLDLDHSNKLNTTNKIRTRGDNNKPTQPVKLFGETLMVVAIMQMLVVIVVPKQTMRWDLAPN